MILSRERLSRLLLFSSIVTLVIALLSFSIIHIWLTYHSLYPYDSANYVHDEGIYAEMSRLVASGEPLYLRLWDNKPPMLFWVGGVFVRLLGNNLFALKIATQTLHLLYGIVIGALMFQLTRITWSGYLTGLLAYTFAVWQGYLEGFNAVFLMTLLASMAMLCAVIARGRVVWLLAGGIFLATSFFSKQVMVFEAFATLGFGMLYAPPVRRWKASLWIILGGLVGVGWVILWMAWRGSLEQFWYSSIYEGFLYAFEPQGKRWHFNDEFWNTFQYYFIGGTLPFISGLLVLAVPALFFTVKNPTTRSKTIVILIWLMGAFMGAFIARSMKRNYFIEVISPLLILNGLSLIVYATWRTYAKWVMVLIWGTALLLNARLMNVTLPTIRDLSQPISLVQEDLFTPAQTLSNSLVEWVEANECIWFWDGIRIYLPYLSARSSCNSAPHSSALMVRESFNIDRNRAQYMQELFDQRPTLHVLQPVWGYFPELQRFADRYRVEPPLFTQEETKLVSVYRVDMSPFHAQVADYGIFEMIGYDLYTPSQVCAGDTIELSLTWRNKTFNTRYYNTFVKLLTVDQTAQIAGIDAPPHPEQSTLDWTVKDMIYLSDRFRLDIPTETPSGEYVLVNGFYDNESGEPLLVSNAQQAGAPYVTLTTLEVVPCG